MRIVCANPLMETVSLQKVQKTPLDGIWATQSTYNKDFRHTESFPGISGQRVYIQRLGGLPADYFPNDSYLQIRTWDDMSNANNTSTSYILHYAYNITPRNGYGLNAYHNVPMVNYPADPSFSFVSNEWGGDTIYRTQRAGCYQGAIGSGVQGLTDIYSTLYGWMTVNVSLKYWGPAGVVFSNPSDIFSARPGLSTRQIFSYPSAQSLNNADVLDSHSYSGLVSDSFQDISASWQYSNGTTLFLYYMLEPLTVEEVAITSQKRAQLQAEAIAAGNPNYLHAAWWWYLHDRYIVGNKIKKLAVSKPWTPPPGVRVYGIIGYGAAFGDITFKTFDPGTFGWAIGMQFHERLFHYASM